ncbi:MULTISPECIES: hypothetical protein [Bacillaceae]|uniref:Uncharacterized protein n=1 Tax=Evansella alkalicola TaxID=745819 RepID=A0ABS6JRN1_9BACI|nr:MULTISPECIES: hypothetical protein [Bacillaceae]MBU9719835.1 hypothetical protein [Bacillus alkalicola]
MFHRKIMVAIITSLIAVIVLNIVAPMSEADGGLFLGLLVYPIYIVPVVFIYGIISSVISELISAKVKSFNNALSLLLHMAFGAGFILPYGVYLESIPFTQHSFTEILLHPMTVYSTIFATIFFLIDYIVKTFFWKEQEEVVPDSD